MRDGRAAPLFAAMRAAADEAEATAAACAASSAAGAQCLRECSLALCELVARLEEVTSVLTGEERAASLTNAHDYLTLMGHSAVAWMWLRSATAATRGLAALGEGGAADAATASEAEAGGFYRGKLHTCTFFFRHEAMPKTEALAKLLLSKDPTVAEMRPGWF